MSRNNLLLIAALVAVAVGLLVSYFPPIQNSVAIWSVVSTFLGYGIRDLFAEAPKADQTPPATGPTP
jgi:hypothetical protein